MRGGIVGAVCACGATYEAFRAVDDAGHALTYASARAMLHVGSDDPELWRSKSRGAVLRFWGDLKRAQWEVTHGYCASVLAADHDDEDTRAEDGDTSFDPATFDNLDVQHVEHVEPERSADLRCDCDHCTVARAVGAEPPVHRWQRLLMESLRTITTTTGGQQPCPNASSTISSSACSTRPACSSPSSTRTASSRAIPTTTERPSCAPQTSSPSAPATRTRPPRRPKTSSPRSGSPSIASDVAAARVASTTRQTSRRSRERSLRLGSALGRSVGVTTPAGQAATITTGART